MEQYKAKDLIALSGLEPIRARPGMYIGSTGEKGLHHLLWEIVDNAIDEAANGHAFNISVVIYPDQSVSVEDDGRGIPVDINKKTNMSGVEMVFTQLHAGGKFNSDNYRFSGGLHGVGASVVNALSSWVKVEVYRNGKRYVQEFASIKKDNKIVCGVAQGHLREDGKTNKRGTFIHFLPDPEVFKTTALDHNKIRKRLRELAFLTKGIRISFQDRRFTNESGDYKSVEYLYNGGLIDYVNHLNSTKSPLVKNIIYFERRQDNFWLRLAMQHTDDVLENIHSYVNNIQTISGGFHETGLKAALTKSLNDYARENNFLKPKDENFLGEDFRVGLTAILSIYMQDPQFEGQTKERLGSAEVKSIVENIVCEEFRAYLNNKKNKENIKTIMQIAQAAALERLAVKRTRELQRQKNKLSGGILVGKFAKCSSRSAEECELFIVEGDSAGGSAKQGRDRGFQAILPLKGKPLNVEKKKIEQIFANEELKTIIYALGTDCHPNFNIEGLKYGKVIILADADQDGAHIRSILLAFFYRYMNELVRQGKVYIGMPPLYKIERGKSEVLYAYDDTELENILANTSTKYKIQRYKGLGEMNPIQLWDTTLNPKTRTLLRVTVDDAVEADLMISTLMGENIAARKEFIFENVDFNKEDNFAIKYGGK